MSKKLPNKVSQFDGPKQSAPKNGMEVPKPRVKPGIDPREDAPRLARNRQATLDSPEKAVERDRKSEKDNAELMASNQRLAQSIHTIRRQSELCDDC
jgi:hypothetical protein